MVFPCSRILYFCFKSLGLDITSVFLNPFKMAATYLFLWFPLLSKNPRLIPSDTLCIEKVWSINSNKMSFWIGNLLEVDSFDFYIEDIFTKLFNLLIGINPRSLPREMNTFFFTRASSCTIYITTQQKERFLWNRTNDVERRAPSFLYKMVDVIHSGSCLSSRTLLSTTSFQTKFYHNIPLI